MADSRPFAPFEPNDAYRYKNKEAVDTVIPHLLRIVLLWGTSVSPGDTFWQYLEKKYSKNINKLNRALRGTTEKKLCTTDSEDFDVTLLKNLIPEVCEDFDCKEGAKKCLADGVTTYLTKLADIRNNVCHNPKTFAISPTVLKEIGAIAPELLDRAAKLLSVDIQTKQIKIKEVEEMLKKVEGKTMSLKENRLNQMMKYFCSEGMKDIEKVVKSESKELLPAGKLKLIRRDLFHEGNVTVVTEDADLHNKQTEKEIRCGSLLQHCKGSDIILLGEPGAGKSSLVMRLREDFVTKDRPVFRGVRMYEMMIFMECRKSSVETIADLVRWNFPETFRRIEADQVVEVLLMIKVLFVVDGVDERNPNSQKLLYNLIDTFGRSERATFIFASRPGASEHLETELDSAGRTTTIAKLQPITEEQERIVFLQRYQATMPGIDAPELINAYKNLDKTCKNLLDRPVHLALFSCLYQSSPDEVSKWTNEMSIMTTILKYSRKLIAHRLEKMIENNPGILADQIMEQACVVSLRQMAENRLTITKKTYDNFCKDLFGQKDVPYEAILSCLYVSQPDQETYEYIHLSHLEFMAAKAIVTELVEKKRQSVIEIISEHEGIQRDGIVTSRGSPRRWPWPDARPVLPTVTGGKDVSLTRFGNVLRFVCMLLNEGGPPMKGALQRFLKEVCPALAREEVCLDYWTDLVLGCPDSGQVARAAAEAAHTVSGREWKVRSSKAMTATSKMLPYRQPALLAIEPLQGEEDSSALAVLLEAVTNWLTGELRLDLNESHDNYSACDASLACLESAQCRLDYFEGCLSGGNIPAWRALIRHAKTAQGEYGKPLLYISLLEPMWHELGQLDETHHSLSITTRPPSSPGDRRRRPLPTSTWCPPDLRVECRPAAGGEVSRDNEVAAALIEDIVPRDMKYNDLFLLHYTGTNGALDGMTTMLSARGVRTRSSSTRSWDEEGSDGVLDCVACWDSSSHRPGERCVRFSL